MGAIRKVMGHVSQEVKQPMRHFEIAARDGMEILSGKRDRLTPPTRLVKFTGGGDFRATGEALVRLFQELGGLKRDERILDVGCGVGRIALALTRYLGSDSSYEGFDAWKEGITWCQRHIARAFPNFDFQHVDCYNGFYNPFGRLRPRDVDFPYPDSSFDFIILNSVFTHMLPGDVMHYLREISRVLSPEGRVYATWFLVADETREIVRGEFRFRHDRGSYLTINEDVPESAVAYPIEWVRAAYEKEGLRIEREQSGQPGNEIQDILWAARA
jgi:SAM-dependent methyltransferase